VEQLKRAEAGRARRRMDARKERMEEQMPEEK
jgi:hypothetical protein